jgi:hypothetical protein
MHCEAKVARFKGNLENLVSSYLPSLVQVPLGRRDNPKYTQFKSEDSGLYLIMVSSADRPSENYDLLVTVMGPNAAKAAELMAGIESKIPVKLKPAPAHLKQTYEEMFKRLPTLYPGMN